MSKPSDSKAPGGEGKSQPAAGVDRRRFFLMADRRWPRLRSCRWRAARPRRTSRRPSASRPATRKPTTSRTTIASTAIDGTTHMLMSEEMDPQAGRACRVSPPAWLREFSTAARSCASQAWPRGGRSVGFDAARIGAQGAGRPENRRRANGNQKEYLHPLLGRLHRDRRSSERRLGRPGTGLG